MQTKDEQIKSLSALNEDFENYFANTVIPQLFVDNKLILRKFTPPAMTQFNLRTEYIGKPLHEIQENFRYPTILNNIQSVIKSGSAFEKEIQTTDMRWYQMNILPYMIPKDNHLNGVIISFVDITARIKDLREQEKLVAEQELLLDTIAHDIKNPLQSLGLLFEMIKKGCKDKPEDLPLLFEHVDSSLNQMKKIIYGLMTSRWNEHRYHADEEIIDIGNVLEDVKLSLSSQLKQAGAIIEEKLEISQITFVRRQLRSVIYNLVNNSIKYADPERGPSVLIKSFYKDDYAIISVSDNGVGISKENQSRLFEKYHKLDSLSEGSGVGLYLVHTIVTDAGGRIEVESEPGKGTTFTIYLPQSIRDIRL